MNRLTRPSPILFLCLFASQAGMLVLSPVLPDVARDLGVSTAAAGQLRSLPGLTGGVTAVLLAMAPRRPARPARYSARRRRASPCWPARRASPASASACWSPSASPPRESGPRPQRPRVLAWAIAGMPAAWIAGMPVVGAVADVSWRAAWLVPTVVALLAVAIVRRRPADRASSRARGQLGAWRHPDVKRFAAGELL